MFEVCGCVCGCDFFLHEDEKDDGICDLCVAQYHEWNMITDNFDEMELGGEA